MVGLMLAISIPAEATLAPRMYSFMTQLSGSLYQSTDAGGSATYNNKLSFELLYLVRNGPTFGGRYIIESRNENESTSGQAYGPMAGYYADNGFFAVFNYDILAKLGRWTNGEGFEFGVGYLEHIGDQMHVGGKISTRKIRYKTDITNNIAVQKDVAETFPSVTFMYLF
jgi:hypothetical protein